MRFTLKNVIGPPEVCTEWMHVLTWLRLGNRPRLKDNHCRYYQARCRSKCQNGCLSAYGAKHAAKYYLQNDKPDVAQKLYVVGEPSTQI